MTQAYVNLPEGQIHYHSAGQGDALLLLHQAPLSAVEWAPLMPLLSPHFRVIAPDMVGHGNSYDPPHEFAMADFTRSTLALMDALRIDRAVICGNHSGAALASSLAIHHPDRVSRVILSSDMLMTTAQAAGYLAKLRSRPLSRELPLTGDGDFLVQAWQRYAALAPGAPLSLRLQAFAVGLAARQRPFDAHEAVLCWRTEADQLARVRCPKLVYAAENDLFFTPAELSAALQQRPDCDTVLLRDAGALSPLEAPAALAAAILRFAQPS